MLGRTLLTLLSAIAVVHCLGRPATAEDTIKVGVILPLTGPFTSTGKQILSGALLYLQKNGDQVAGKRIKLIVKDDANAADQTKRLTQELIVNDKVDVLAGYGLTPLAFTAAPIATSAQVPMVVMGCCNLKRDREVALHHSHQLPAGCVALHSGRLDGQERNQDSGNARI